YLLNGKGLPLFEYSPGGSRIAVIVGSAVAPDNSLIAAVSGIDPQVLTVFRRGSSGYASLATLRLSSDFRREIRMGFSPDSRFCFLEGMSGAGLFDPGAQTLRWVSLRGRIAGAAFPGHGRLAAFSSRDGGRAQLVIEPPAGVPIYREEFAAQEVSLGSIDGQL